MDKERDKAEKKDVKALTDGNAPYLTPTPGEIPIIASTPLGTVNGLIYNAEECLKRVEECGINTVIATEVKFTEISGNILKTNLKMIVAQQTLNKTVFCKFVSDNKNNPRIAGWLMFDEPHYYNWHDTEGADVLGDYPPSKVDSVRKTDLRPIYKEVRELDPDKMMFFNLAVSMGKHIIGNCTSYEQYLQSFQNVFYPPVWMFDFYPVEGGSDKVDPQKYKVLYSDFYKALNDFRKISILTQRPFWYYCQSVSYKIKKIITGEVFYKFPTPTVQIMRYEVFTALAFGAKGISYWFYSARPDEETGKNDDNLQLWIYLTSPVNYDRETMRVYETDIWNYMHQINSEIKKYTKVFLDTDVVGVYQSNNENFKDGSILALPYKSLTKLECESLDSGTAPGVIVSHLRKGNVNYFVMVSKSVTRPQKVTTRFSSSAVKSLGGGGIISQKDVTDIDGIYVNETAWEIEAGGYLIFTWEQPESDTGYIRPFQGQIPMIVSSVYPEIHEPEMEDFETAMSCGVNTIIGRPHHIDKLFEIAECTGMKIIVTQASFPPDMFIDIVRKYKDNPFLAGWLLNDQPFYYNLYPGAEVSMCDTSSLPSYYSQNLKQLYDYIRHVDPEHMVYFNFACTENPCYIGNNANYELYLRNLYARFNLPLWSFDLYPVTGGDTDWTVNYEWFYKYLLIYRNICVSTGRPFWYYAQCVSYKFKGKMHFPTPTEAMMRYEAFTALAFGAKGIVFWYYAQRKNEPNWEYVISPVTEDRQKTAVWYSLRMVISEIQELDGVFLDTEVVNIFTHGMPAYGIGVLKVPYGPLELMLSDNPGFIVSHLRRMNTNYLLMVSKDLKRNQKLTTRFNVVSRVYMIGGRLVAKNMIHASDGVRYSDETNWTIEAGGYIIFRWYD